MLMTSPLLPRKQQPAASLTDIDFLAWIASAKPGATLEYHRSFLCVDCAELVNKLAGSDCKRLLTLSDVAARA